MLQRLPAIALALAAALPASALAEDAPDAPALRFRGFGTLGLTHSSERHADFTTTIFRPHGVGRSGAWSADVDSRLGLQLDATLAPSLTAVVQVISELRYDGSYQPTVEWANLKYQATPDLSLRVGRIALPGFAASDYGRVGYAMPWVRPPRDFYTLAQVTNNDGVDLSWRRRIGGARNLLQAYAGGKDIRTTYENGAIIRARHSIGFADTIELDDVSLRASWQRGDLTMDASRPLFDAFRAFGAAGARVADEYDIDHKPYTLLSLGAGIDRERWFASGEWARLRTRSWAGDGSGWYLSGGLRQGAFTPYATFSRVRLDSPLHDPGVPTAGLPPALAFTVAQGNAYLNGLLGITIPDAQTIGVGVRWDVARNTALKLQYNRMALSAGSSGALRDPDPQFVPGGRLHLVSMTVDFVF